MKCPKCSSEIDEKMIVCPHCKKVLKLVCPKCKTINKTNACKKCGFTIITKCHNCGKINQTINEKCSKCGFSTFTSVAINSSNIDEFACLTIEFPNINEIKKALGSTKLFEKFKYNLDLQLQNYAISIGSSREIIDSVYVVRFNKENSFKKSCQLAVTAAIEILNKITELNFKLKSYTQTTLKCNIAILKRDIYSKPEEYKSGFNIKLIYEHKKDLNLLNNLQVITDSYIYEQICDKYDLSSLTATFVKNEMITFFELKLKKYIKIPKEKENDEEKPQEIKKQLFPDIQTEDDKKDELYNINAINFDEIKCTFANSKTADTISDIINILKNSPKKIISIKGKKALAPISQKLISSLENSLLYENVIHIQCYDNMKFKPYGFFYDLISQLYNFAQSPKLFASNNFSDFSQIDKSNFIKDLINLNERKFPHPEDVRYSLFDLFLTIFKALKKTVIYVENFDKIDETSKEFLNLFFEKAEEFDISFIFEMNEETSLHKNAHFLLSTPNYIEISTKPSSFEEILGANISAFSNIIENYYLQKIAQNAKGSPNYTQNALEYLIDKKALQIEKKKYIIAEEAKNVVIPSSLEELFEKRLSSLEKDLNTFELFCKLVLIGPRIDFETINTLNNADIIKIIKDLTDKSFIYTKNSAVFILNHSYYFKAVCKTEPNQIAKDLLEKIYLTDISHPNQALLENILILPKQEFLSWEKLSKLNASMGDFSAYLNCSIKFLKLLDSNIRESSEKTIEEYKLEVYENISNLLYKYTPNKIHNITQIILQNLETSTDDKKVINLCNKMLQGCLIGGNYSYALELVHKILSRLKNSSLNPNDTNFNSAFFLVSLIKIEILFSIGNFKDCVISGTEIINYINSKNLQKLKPQNLSLKEFEEVIEDTSVFILLSKIILLQKDLDKFVELYKDNMEKIPEAFGNLYLLEKVLRGEKITVNKKDLPSNDKFSKVIFNLIQAFQNSPDSKAFADYIYKAKINAKKHKLTQFELVCDLLIGLSYFSINQSKKALSIYYNVLDISVKNGLKTVIYLAWYFISVLKFEQREIEVAFGIATNAIIQLEKDSNSSDILFLLFKIILAKIFEAKNDTKSANLCIENAKFIKNKYGLKFKIGETS